MNNNIDLISYVGQTVTVSWTQSKGGSLSSSDGLDFAISKDGGNNWGPNIQPPPFRGNNPSPTFTYIIPNDYLTSQFRMRFSVVGCTSSGRYVYVDNIRVSLGGSPAENARTNQIMFNGIKVTANPATGGVQTQQSGATDAPNSLSYSCFYDVTALVLQMINDRTLGPSGSGTYTVGHVLDWPGVISDV